MSRLPFELSIPKPCTQQWSEMPGSSTTRHCASCNTSVHNLAALTPRQIERIIRNSNGHLCARIERKADGDLVTAVPRKTSLKSTFVLASTLTASAAFAQIPQSEAAVVTGTILTPADSHYISEDSPREVLFIQSDKVVLTVTSDRTGKFSATLPAGTYDVVFRNGLLFGERVKNVAFHAGDQEFGPVQERFDYGHLAEVDGPAETIVTVGELLSVPIYRLTPRNLLLHPVGVGRELASRAKRLLHLSS